MKTWEQILEDKKEREIEASGTWGQSFSISFNGEKNFGEIGSVVRYDLDHQQLAYRSWQSYLTSNIAKTALQKLSIWIIGKGLRLNSHPNEQILKANGINLNVEKFTQEVEALWKIWAESNHSTLNGMQTFNELMHDCYLNSKIGGDVLQRLHVVNGELKVSITDSLHLHSLTSSNIFIDGIKIDRGVKVDVTGRHIEYSLLDVNQQYKTIPCFASNGLRIAFLVYGDKYRIEDTRGLPISTTVLETIKKLDRYKEAAVGSAEERQKVVYAIEHQLGGSGENPMADKLANLSEHLMGAFSENKATSADSVGNKLAGEVAVSTNKQAFNLPQGATMKALESRNELYFTDFYTGNKHEVYSTFMIPPNVAEGIYNDSFSASRAATKDWEHTMDFGRNSFHKQSLNPTYMMFVYLKVLTGKLNAPGFLNAFNTGNWEVVEAYLSCRFTGDMFPHIDPVKEVTAERLKLGELGKNIPLTTVESATENLMSGESSANIRQFAREFEETKKLKLVSPENTANGQVKPVQ